MGEYWWPVNMTRREYIHPHEVGNGLKWGELVEYDSATRRRMELVWSDNDDVRAISDYGGDEQLTGQRSDEPSPSYYDDVEGKFRDVSK